jgi:hypothetical protein
MNDFFDEKSRQIEPAAMQAFGIMISSRHAKAKEIIEMISFCRLLAAEEVSGVKNLFYDSNSDCCFIECDAQIASDSANAKQIESVANRSLAQYELFGTIGHGLVLVR